MVAEWPTAKIEDIAERVAMGPFGSAIKVSTFVPEGIPVISGQHLRGFKLDDSVGYNFIAEDHANRLKKANVQRGDIIFTHAGNIGQVALVPANSKYERYVISQRQFYLRVNPEIVLPEFLVAYFKSPIGQHQLLANASQVGVPSISRPVTYLRSLEVPIPTLEEQRAIAAVLGALDDKIEHNRRTAQKLEELARAIFRAWFVDFEPVKAKAAGRTSFPSMPQPVFDALPTSFTNTELGPVPEGWEVKPLNELIEVNPPRTLKKGELAPYLAMKNMPVEGHSPNDIEMREYRSGTKFTNGDTLVARITPCLENGKTAFVDFLQKGEVGWGSTEYIVLHPNKPIPPVFAYLLARSKEFRSFAINSMTGTSGRQRVPYSILGHYLIVQPPSLVFSSLGEVLNPLVELANVASKESKSLAKIRDLLLPQLISGQMRVRGGG